MYMMSPAMHIFKGNSMREELVNSLSQEKGPPRLQMTMKRCAERHYWV
jgi:hypothetical protein